MLCGLSELKANIETISLVSSEKNVLNKIGGLLEVDLETGKIRQTLEGREENVRQLTMKIRNDQRHAYFKLIEEETIKKRKFSSWEMGVVYTLKSAHARDSGGKLLRATWSATLKCKLSQLQPTLDAMPY